MLEVGFKAAEVMYLRQRLMPLVTFRAAEVKDVRWFGDAGCHF